jgi:hypothetical protein
MEYTLGLGKYLEVLFLLKALSKDILIDKRLFLLSFNVVVGNELEASSTVIALSLFDIF